MWTARGLAKPARAAFAALTFVLALTACDATTTRPTEDTQGDTTFLPSSTGGSPASGMSTAGAGVSSPGSSSGSSSGGQSATPPPNAAHDAGPASAAHDAGVAVGMSGAGAASQSDAGTRCMVGPTPVDMCPLPASSCVSASTLMFFENPHCVEGHCVWDSRLMRCPSGDCNEGFCGSNLTLL